MTNETTSPASTLLAAAEELARLTGSVALQHYRSALRVERKADGSPVTAADRAAEQAAREWVRKRFPDDGVFGEEFGEERPGAHRRWVIDPIDGTKSFVRGVPLWGSLVALCEGETVLAGAAFFPAVDELVVAAPGAGGWWDGRRCSVSRLNRKTGRCMGVRGAMQASSPQPAPRAPRSRGRVRVPARVRPGQSRQIQ